MTRRFSIMVAGAVMTAAVMTVSAQTQTPSKSIKVLGCLQRTGNNVFVLKDMRAEDSFRLDPADKAKPEDELDFHAGHLIEVTGTLTDTTANPPRLKVAQIVYLARTCPAPTPAKK
jgi:hypothetical protein